MDESKIMSKILTSHGVRIAFATPAPKDIASENWACAGVDPELFFPSDDHTLAAAKRVCAACPLQLTCQSLAAARSESGVWGGVLFDRGTRLDAVPVIGRPRKNAA